MHNSVRNHFIEFNEPIEARVEYMYLDIKGLVTIGVGNLIDVESGSVDKVLDEIKKMPFVYKQGTSNKKAGQKASAADVETEWKRVKDKQEWAKRRHTVFEGFTELRLSDEAIDSLVMTKLNAIKKELMHVPAFWDFRKWPADAQLGLLSMAWALGVPKLRTRWPNFRAACKKQDFDEAAKRCTIRSADNPGVIPRNHANKQLFNNAAAVLANDGTNLAQNNVMRATLYYPGMLMKPIIIRG